MAPNKSLYHYNYYHYIRKWVHCVECIWEGSAKMTTESSKNDATTLSCMNFSAYIGHTYTTIFSWMLTTACCLVVRLWLELGLDLVSGWLMVMHTCLYYFPLSLSHSLRIIEGIHLLSTSRVNAASRCTVGWSSRCQMDCCGFDLVLSADVRSLMRLSRCFSSEAGIVDRKLLTTSFVLPK